MAWILLLNIYKRRTMKKNGNSNVSRIQAHSNVLKELGRKIKGLFRFEEVEVTFNDRGKSYTYRVITHK